MTANQGSTSYRNIPDVALTADNIYVTYDNGGSAIFGGTSCAAPLWAGFTALMNEQAALYHEPSIGFLNPLVYAIGKGTNYAASFHDTTVGDNSGFPAVTGYDLCTGWGTPKLALANLLAPPDPLQISPTNGFSAIGPVGGPFTNSSLNLNLTNLASTNLSWTITSTPSWLTCSATNGVLAGRGATTVNVSLAAPANSFAAGLYTGSIQFADAAGFSQNRTFALAVLGLPIITNQPVAQTNTQGGTAIFTVGVFGVAPLNYQWRVNGGNIAGATNPSLTLTNLLPSNAGTYSVVITNTVGSATSANAALKVIGSVSRCMDDFENGIDASQWFRFTGTVTTTSAAASSGASSLLVSDDGSATTLPIDVSNGAEIHFSLRLFDDGTSMGTATLPADGLSFDYSTDGGATWHNIATYTTEDLFLWKLLRPSLPAGAQTAHTLFRWQHIQPKFGQSTWALDDVGITTGNSRPWISAQPTDRYVLAGTNATFTVQGEGATPLSFQWKFNGTNVTGATNSTYTITNVTAQNLGTAFVVITNIYGAITSKTARVTLTSFTNRPRVLYVTGMGCLPPNGNTKAAYGPGEDLRSKLEQTGLFSAVDLFRLSATDTPSLGLLQQYNAVITSIEKIDAFADDRALVSATGRTSDALNDYLSGTGGAVFSYGWFWGEWSQQALTNGYMPFQIEPWNGNLYYGQTLVPVLPSHPLLEGVNQFNSGQNTWLIEDGQWHLPLASNATLVANFGFPISLLAFTQQGDARVVGINTLPETSDYRPKSFSPATDGIHLFANSLLWVAQRQGSGNPPQFTRTQTNEVVSNGKTTSFYTTASGTAPLYYQWYKDGSLIAGATDNSLNISNVMVTDAGTYSVIASNLLGLAQTSNTLTVLPPPTITVQPQDTNVPFGVDTWLSVSAAGSSFLHYYWYSNGVYVFSGYSNLFLSHILGDYSGTYSVIVSNAEGIVHSRDAMVTVCYSPVITSQPTNAAIFLNDPAQFSVRATGNRLSYQWRKNGAVLPDKTDSALAISTTQLTDFGSYSVVVTNVAGTATSADALLSVNTCTIHLLNVVSNANGSIGLTFSTDPGITYNFQYKSNLTDAHWNTISTSVASSTTTAVIDSPSDSQRFYRLSSACAASEAGGFIRLSLLSNSDSFISLPFVRPPAVLGSVVSVNGNVVTLSLQNPAVLTVNQLVYAAGTQSNNYYARFVSGGAQGPIYPVTANDINSVTLDLSSGSLAAVLPGDLIVIEPYWTLNSVFPNGAGVNVSPNLGTRNTEVLIPDLAASGINLSAATIYFFNGAWKQVGQGNVDFGDVVLPPNTHIIVRHNVATNTTLMAIGVADDSVWTIPLRAPDGSAGANQDNYIGLARASAMSLDASGLISSGAFAASPLPGSRTDELLVFDNTTIAKNKSASSVYYYWSNAWRRVGAGSTARGSDLIFTPGAAAILRKGTNAVSPVWTNTSPY